MNQENNLGIEQNQQPTNQANVVPTPVVEAPVQMVSEQVQQPQINQVPVEQPQINQAPVEQPQIQQATIQQPAQVQQPVSQGQVEQPQISDGVNFKNMSYTQKAGSILIVFALFAAYSFLTSFDGSAINIILSFVEMVSSIAIAILLLLNKKKEASIAGLVLAAVFAIYGVENVISFFKEMYTMLFDNSLIKYNFKYIFPDITSIILTIVSIVLNVATAGTLALTFLPDVTKKELTVKQKSLVEKGAIGIVVISVIYVILTILHVIVFTTVYSTYYDLSAAFKLMFQAIFFGMLRIIFNASLVLSILVLNQFDFKAIKAKFTKKQN